MKKLILTFLFFTLSFCAFAKKDPQRQLIDIIKDSYPDVKFKIDYIKKYKDYKIEITLPDSETTHTLYWCDGKMLPENELVNKDNYLSILYEYPKEIIDPSTFTEAQKEELKNYGTVKNRRNAKGSSMFFFDILYSADSQKNVEKNIISVSFLGKGTRIHERIKTPLKNVEKKIKKLAETDASVKKFVDGMKSCDAYHWRLIDGTDRKSYHSLGTAIDVLPKRITGEIFWSWARDKNPSGWYMTPLSRRWLPPDAVVKIFEEEGFIWGGKWAIWDNMHFEYRPDLIRYNFK